MYSSVEQEKKKKGLADYLRMIFHRRKKRLFSDLEIEFQTTLDLFTIYSFIFLVIGVLFSLWNTAGAMVIRIFFGLLFMIYGMLQFYTFSKRRKLSLYNFSIVYGIVAFFLAIFSFCVSDLVILLIVLGIFLLLQVVEHFIQGFYLLRARDMSISVLLGQMALFVFMAVILFINPFLQLYVGQILGIFAILYGILNIACLSFLSKKSQVILSFFE